MALGVSRPVPAQTSLGEPRRVDSGAPTEMAPVVIGSRRKLFVDKALIGQLHDVEFRLQQPRPAEVVLRADRPWEGEFTTGANVIQHGDKYQMYYPITAKSGWILSNMCLGKQLWQRFS